MKEISMFYAFIVIHTSISFCYISLILLCVLSFLLIFCMYLCVMMDFMVNKDACIHRTVNTTKL